MKQRLKNLWTVFIWIILLTFPVPGQTLDDLHHKIPVPVRLLLREAGNLMDLKKYQGAIEKITVFQSQNSDNSISGHPMVLFLLGNCHYLQADYFNAVKAYKKALEIAPDYTDARINLAKTYGDLKKFADSAQCFLTAYDLSQPQNPDFLYYCATAWMMSEADEKAVAVFEKLFESHPKAIIRQWQENYANALIAAGHTERAVPLIQGLIDQTGSENRQKWQNILLQIYIQAGNFQKAMNYANDLVRTQCSRADLWKSLVHIHLSLGRYPDALVSLIIYGYLTPLSDTEKQLQADLCLQLSIPDQAARLYEAILDETPDKGKTDKQTRQHLALAYQQMGMSEKAVAVIARFKRTNQM